MNLQRKQYFDCNATSPLDEGVIQNITLWAQEWGNPSSIHWASRGPKQIIREARAALAQGLDASPLEIIFTSGGSESNNTVIRGVYSHFKELTNLNKNHFITSQIEHPSVIKTMLALAGLGAKVDFISVSRAGYLDMDQYKESLKKETALVSLMMANNETGVLFPIQELADLAHEQQALFHTDGVQALGKIPISLKSLGVDYASFSGHKFYSLKGTGALFVKKGAPFLNLILGGGQERHRRGGTENTLGIASLGFMAQKLSQTNQKNLIMSGLRDFMEELIMKEISDVQVNSKMASRLPNTSSFVISGVDGETLLMSLDLKGYAVSTGAACSSGNPEPSPVLLAIGLSRAEAQSSLRVSLGWYHTEEDVKEFVFVLKSVVDRLRNLNRNNSNSFEVKDVR